MKRGGFALFARHGLAVERAHHALIVETISETGWLHWLHSGEKPERVVQFARLMSVVFDENLSSSALGAVLVLHTHKFF